MKNKVFMQKSTEQKRRYLCDVLGHVGGGVLDRRTIGRILPKVAINKQYAISAFSDNLSFQEAVARAQIGKVRMSVVYSRTAHGATAVVITPLGHAGSKNSKRVIYIHAPILHTVTVK